MSYAVNARTERINIRVRPALKRILRQAAAATDKTVSQFLLEVGLAQAMAVLSVRTQEHVGGEAQQAESRGQAHTDPHAIPDQSSQG
jgi:uncharacterized protein (DUF1778 family)